LGGEDSVDAMIFFQLYFEFNLKALESKIPDPGKSTRI
jgi:hypothetical protein